MKKQLLAGAFILASFFTAQAQTAYSFETGEGYTIGALSNQNSWGVSATVAATTTVNNTLATDGTNSILLTGTGATVTSLVGAFSPAISITGNVEVSFDVRLTEISAAATSFYIATQSPSQQKLTARIVFAGDGQVAVLDTDPDGTAAAPLNFFLIDGDDSVANTWYNVRIVHDFTASTVTYFINNQQVYVADAWGATNVEQLVIAHDNAATGGLYVDNIEVKSATAGVKENTLTSLSVFPNPTSGVVTIANNENILVNGVTVTDLNGRTVKTVNFAGVAEAQVNISDLSTGVYMMTISSDKGTTTKKIVKN